MLKIVATSFDSHEELLEKYPESVKILEKLHAANELVPDSVLQVHTRHRVDATQISETLADESLLQDLDEVTFCHPHIGSEHIQKNSALVAHFFASASKLRPKLIQVTLLDSQFERWQIETVAKFNQLQHLQVCELNSKLFEYGYETRRHQSGKSFSTSKVGRNFTIQSRAHLFASSLIEIADL